MRLLRFLSLGIFPAALLVGCNGDLVERIDRLEAELREVRSDTRDEVADLKNRVISSETQIGFTSDKRSFTDRLNFIENSLDEAIAQNTDDNEMVYLRPLVQGHTPLHTDHGTFLVRLEGIDLNPAASGGYIVHVNVGNPNALSVQQFTLQGDHGGGTPELAEGEDYNLKNEKIRAWQETLKPFEYRVTKSLEPFTWTPFDIELAADSREELELIRFRMIVENARLNREFAGGGGSGNSFAHISVDAEGASMLKTEYGAFLVTVKKAEATEVGTKLYLEIGNPYGFTINQCRLIGEVGPEIPAREDSATQEAFATAMQSWTANLMPFESMISSEVANFRWNEATILIPAQPENVKFLRCQLRVEDVTLPAAGPKRSR